MANITKLPPEIIKLIAGAVDRDDLKALRLTGRTLSTIATRLLFREIHISPNSFSFDRAHCVAACRHLTEHVRSLVYHFGKLGEFYAGFETFKREYFLARKVSDAQDPYAITPEMLWCYNCWLEEIDAQRTFELRYESDELQDICNRLPRLEAIATILDESNPFGEQGDYIGRRTGMAATEDDGWSRFPCLFAAAMHKPLRKVSARSIQWHNLGFMEEGSSDGIEPVQICLSRLKFLELGIYGSQIDFDVEVDDSEGGQPAYLHHIELLDAILTHASNLTTLKLDFDELPYESTPEVLLPVSVAIFKHHWPRLHELKLEAICAHEDELCMFLESHRHTLRKLCIGDIELVAPETAVDILETANINEQKKHIPSILRMFSRLHRSLTLQSCRITGNFTNRLNQSWYVNIEHDEPNCLRDQIEKYLCGGRGSTSDAFESSIHFHDDFDEIELNFDLSSSDKMERLDTYVHGYAMQGMYEEIQDDSWQWAPELLQ